MIHTKVAKIVSPTSVVLAAGSEQGVKQGMEFVIFVLSDEVKDPETRESLGRIELHKGRVRVTHVEPRMSLASTLPRFDRHPFFSTTFGGESLLDTIRSNAPLEELQVDRSQIGKPIDLVVRVGDTAHSLQTAPVLEEATA